MCFSAKNSIFLSLDTISLFYHAIQFSVENRNVHKVLIEILLFLISDLRPNIHIPTYPLAL